jgi:hypothetical protein
MEGAVAVDGLVYRGLDLRFLVDYVEGRVHVE